VYVHSAPDAVDDPPLHLLWATAYLWNNEGDRAVLYDAANQVVEDVCYKAGCP
jgi:hypothetical protein